MHPIFSDTTTMQTLFDHYAELPRCDLVPSTLSQKEAVLWTPDYVAPYAMPLWNVCKTFAVLVGNTSSLWRRLYLDDSLLLEDTKALIHALELVYKFSRGKGLCLVIDLEGKCWTSD